MPVWKRSARKPRGWRSAISWRLSRCARARKRDPMRFWEQPRQPCVGLFLCAVAGILSAERWACDSRLLAVALLLGALAWLRWKMAPLFWLVVFAAFFLLHIFSAR